MIPELDLAAQKEEALYKERSTHMRFMQQIFLGLGGATVFGVVGVLTRSLLDKVLPTLSTSTLFSMPMLGLAGLAVAGVACLYLGAKYLSNTIMMEQDYSAKKAAMLQRARAPQLAQTVEMEHTKPVSVTPIAANISETPNAPQQQPQLVVHDVSSHQRLADPDQRMQAL